MSISARVLSKIRLAYGIEIDICYTCPHCDEDISETITLDDDICSSSVELCDQECPACGACNDVEVDLD